MRRWLARHENWYALLWYLGLVRNEDPGSTPRWLVPALAVAAAFAFMALVAVIVTLAS